MNQGQNPKTFATKVLAIIGFFTTVVFAIWLVVQAVSFAPTAFSSLASIADTIYNYRPVHELSITTEKAIVNTGELFTISWTKMGRDGNYSFSYACKEGISIDVAARNESIVSVPCGQPLELGDTESLDITITSEKNRFSEVPFTLSFRGEDTVSESEGKITVVNATIPQGGITAAETEVTETEEDEPPVAETAEAPQTPVEETPKEQTVVTYIPTSEETGFTDLKMSYLGVGTIVENNFIAQSVISNEEQSAIRFDVRNIGTKTSGVWTFNVTLPSGFEFVSEEQAPLKPNERAEFTLGFTHTSEVGTRKVAGTLTVENDTDRSNDSFNWSVTVVD